MEPESVSVDPRRDSVHCQQVVRLVCWSHSEVDPWFKFVFWVIVWRFAEGGVAFGVLTAFFFVGVLMVGFSRAFLVLVFGVVWFAVGGAVDARGVRGCGTFAVVLFVGVIMLIIRRCVVWRFFFISSVIVHVPDAWKSIVASKRLSLSLKLDLDFVFEGFFLFLTMTPKSKSKRRPKNEH